MDKTKIRNKTMIYIVRHGETDWNIEKRMQGTTDIPLNNKGKRQAQNIAKHLKNIEINTIYSSPLTRAFETATIIKVHHPQTPLVKIASLKERSFGSMEGKTQAEFDGLHPGLNWERSWEYPEYRPPNGESLREVYARVSTWMQNILKAHNNQSIVLVTHGVTLRMIIKKLIGTPMNQLGTFHSNNASLTIIEYTDGHEAILHITNYVVEERYSV